ncbi:HEAT repeat protein [Planctopirus ephydatiae]|uniref:HEAT repeat protein n=1 Tax=Planctopirus ephydatiae TaxID=2528019 RepID=A0A518GJY7_9PLAN|nr:HEAT repeat protein [Planctopirus ephydatiae]
MVILGICPSPGDWPLSCFDVTQRRESVRTLAWAHHLQAEREQVEGEQPARQPANDAAGDARQRVDLALQTLDYTQPPAPELLADLKRLVESDDVDDLVRRRAAIALARLGSRAPSGVVSLKRVLTEVKSGKERASTLLWVLPALGRYGLLAHETAANLALIAFDSHYPEEIQLSAIAALVEMGATREGLAVIEKLLTNRHLPLELRTAGMQGVIAYRQEASMLLPQVMRWLDDEDFALRAMAAEAIGGFGERAMVAEERLAAMFLDDPAPLARESAAQALLAISPQPPLWIINIYDETMTEIAKVEAAMSSESLASTSGRIADDRQAELALKLAALRLRQLEILQLIGSTRDWQQMVTNPPGRPASSDLNQWKLWRGRFTAALKSDSLKISLMALEILLRSNALEGVEWQQVIQRGLLSSSPEERRATVMLFQKYPWDAQCQTWLEGLLKELQGQALQIEDQAPAVNTLPRAEQRLETLQRADGLAGRPVIDQEMAQYRRLLSQQMAAVRAALRAIETRKVPAP